MVPQLPSLIGSFRLMNLVVVVHGRATDSIELSRARVDCFRSAFGTDNDFSMTETVALSSGQPSAVVSGTYWLTTFLVVHARVVSMQAKL